MSPPKHETASFKVVADVGRDGTTALAASYNDRIRPLLDAVDCLRHLKVTQEGIQLPTIVVVGDQSSGKSSVLESLAGISLPRGQGICTRVPLVMRLQHDPAAAVPLIQLQYYNQEKKLVTVDTTEAGVTAAIRSATDVIAGSGKGILNTPLTLVVRKRGVPDLTMVDLPGITRVPVHGQPENIYEQISDIITEYITPKESIILNVLSATVDFPTCESIRMSQRVDPTGERTLAVVTKVDKAPEGLLEKVTADDVNIGLGYVCVRNRVGDETYEQARKEEARLFGSHPLLSKIDKSIVGVPVLAQRLTQIQASIVTRCLPEIVEKINDKLRKYTSELDDMPRNLSTAADAVRVLFHILKQARETLEKILVRGDFDDFPDDRRLHGTARVAEMLHKYAAKLPAMYPTVANELFLMEEVQVLEETKGIRLPNFPLRSAFLTILRRKINIVSPLPHEFVAEVWAYVEIVATEVLLKRCENYPQLHSAARRAMQSLMEKTRGRSAEFVGEMIEMELAADYTSNPDYVKSCCEMEQQLDVFTEAVKDTRKPPKVNVRGEVGEVDVAHLRQHREVAEQAFEMHVRLAAYWRSVVLRIVDGAALHVQRSIRRVVERELEAEVVREAVGRAAAGIDLIVEEGPATAAKRERLKKRIELLRQSKDVVANITDRIAIDI
ncbi:dynamin-related protein 4C [Ananas comosus]|uniref:Dynamin-related protein 4C n=1 Tax=Ananas comosus TaxID=4615 RepID=A0A6P5GFD3_ANACO|nr:dynamin-related protein 4C [Ananas comosus]